MQKKIKSEIRSDLLQHLNGLKAQQKTEASKSIQDSLKKILADQGDYWGAYQALPSEPLIDWSAVSKQITWCFPVTEGKKIVFKAHSQNFKKSNFSVNEPVDGLVVPIENLKGVIAPGLGFTKKGLRLGWGQGFYDRSLAGFNGKKIGVCFESSITEKIPSEDHDIYFNQIVTESFIYQVGHSEGEVKWN